ncbi:hypothetical protein [Nonlabens sp.]|uniref:hypothetical protein n=1 Tax=Nonlabens sp. TaxID=1888209 RepID=UPI003F69F150
MKKTLSVLTLFTVIAVQAQLPQSSPLEISSEQACEMQLVKKLDFMLDGSFTHENVLFKEIAKLRPCGLDDFDVTFFSDMDVFNTMLTRISKHKKVEQMTFSDVYTEILKFKKAAVYKEIREVTMASEELGQTTGTIKNWEQDLTLFENLGASTTVIQKVYDYLKSNPDNEKTYKEILELLKEK